MPHCSRKFAPVLLVIVLALTTTSALVMAQDHGHDVDLDCDIDAVVAHQQEHAAVLDALADDLLHDPDAALEALYTTGIAYQALAVECGFDRTTEAEAAHQAEHATSEPGSLTSAVGDPENGEVIFNTVQPENGFACATCHRVDSTERLIGPGLLGVGSVGHDPSAHADGGADAAHTDGAGDHAAVEPTEEAHDMMGDMSMGDNHASLEVTEEAHSEQTLDDVMTYIRTSILHPNDYVVPGYPSDLMPQNYAEILTDEEIDDLVAYLLTLK